MHSFVFPPEPVRAAGKYQQAFSRIEEVLLDYEKITLAEMDSVQLQDRMDTKLIFHIERLPFFLSAMKEEYQVFEINNIRLNPYQTLYFDDEKWSLYHMHHNEKTNRFKLRFRSYLSSDLSFFEIKYKNNKGRTIKERIRVPEITAHIEDKSKELLSEVLPENKAVFRPKLWVNYSRITFVSKQKTERVTIDLNLIYKNMEKELALSELVIAEVKQGRASTESPFLKLMKNNGIRPGSISKYCLGVMMLEREVKKNNFKMKLIAVNKILNQPKA